MIWRAIAWFFDIFFPYEREHGVVIDVRLCKEHEHCLTGTDYFFPGEPITHKPYDQNLVL